MAARKGKGRRPTLDRPDPLLEGRGTASAGEAVRRGALELATHSGNPRLDAELLLRNVLGWGRAQLLAHPDSPLSVDQFSRYRALLSRRARQEPMQYILGEQEFYGLALEVSSAVLIPRPETEHLVEEALARVPSEAAWAIADVGTGSGAIAIAVAHHRARVSVTALDLSTMALEVASANAERHAVGGRIRFVESDLLSAVSGERFSMIVSNPPYVPEGEVLEAQVRDWEPGSALFAGVDGLEVYRRLIPEAATALLPGGWLLMEMGHGQRAAIAALLSRWEEVDFTEDLQGIARVAVARMP